MNINLTLFSQALSFAILIWFTVKFVWPPLMAAIEARQKTITQRRGGGTHGGRGAGREDGSGARQEQSGIGSQAIGRSYPRSQGKNCRDRRAGRKTRQRNYRRSQSA